MIRETVNALLACVVSFVLCAVAYPAVVWGVSRVAFPKQAEGSLIERDGKVIGSALVAQPFASEKYIQPRPSGVDYKADATGGSNLGTKNPDLRKKVIERLESFKATPESPIPTDLIAASGAGLDPDVSVDAARYQAAKVAAARHVAVDKVRSLIDRHLNHSGAVIGAPPRVNVLALNLALDAELPASTATEAATSTKPSVGTEPAPVEPSPGVPAEAKVSAVTEAKAEMTAFAAHAPLAELQGQLGKVAEQIDQLQKKWETQPSPISPEAIKGLETQLSSLSEQSAKIDPLSQQMEALDDRLKTNEGTLEALRKELAQTREILQGMAARSASASGAVERSEEKVVAAVNKPKDMIDLAPGQALFQKGQYAEALKFFVSVTQGHGDDARAWYLAALSNGLASNNWEGDTGKYLNKGIERERAGTPSVVDINAALAGLTKATGGEWLSYYRQRAARP